MTTIFVAKLDFGVTEDELLAVFKQHGNVTKVNIAKDKETGKPRGFAFVEMSDDAQAKEAIRAVDGYSFNGRRCVVKEAEDRGGNKEQSGGRPNNFQRGDSKPFNRPQQQQGNRSEPRERTQDELPPMRPNDDDDAPSFSPPAGGKPAPVKKKKTGTRQGETDSTNDGKNKKPKMNAYKKSGKDSIYFDEDEELEFDLFGRDEEEDELDDDYSQYLVNNDDSDEEWEDDEWDEEEEEWEDDDQ